MRQRPFAGCGILLICSFASAAIIYAPVQYQPYYAPTTQSATAPASQPILIIPKGLPNQPSRPDRASVAAAR